MSAPVSAAWRWGVASATCLFCRGKNPPRRRRFCSEECADKFHRADRTALLAAVSKAIRRGSLRWDGRTLTVCQSEKQR